MIDFSKCSDHLLFRLSPSTCLIITVHKFMVKCLCMDSSRNAVFFPPELTGLASQA